MVRFRIARDSLEAGPFTSCRVTGQEHSRTQGRLSRLTSQNGTSGQCPTPIGGTGVLRQLDLSGFCERPSGACPNTVSGQFTTSQFFCSEPLLLGCKPANRADSNQGVHMGEESNPWSWDRVSGRRRKQPRRRDEHHFASILGLTFATLNRLISGPFVFVPKLAGYETEPRRRENVARSGTMEERTCPWLAHF